MSVTMWNCHCWPLDVSNNLSVYFISNLVLVSACVNWRGSSAFGIYIFIYWYFLIFSYKLTVSNGLSLMVWKCVAVTFSSRSFKWGGGEGRGRTSAFGIYIFIYILVFSYKLMVSNGFSLTVWKRVAVTFSSSSFEWGGGEGRGGGRTSAKVGSSAKFELTCRFMLCFSDLKNIALVYKGTPTVK